MLLDPHSLEFRIMIHVGTRRALPTPAKAGKPMPEIKEEGLALLLAIAADINSHLPLFAYCRSDGLSPSTIDRSLIDRLPVRTQGVKSRKLPRARQTSSMSRQYSAVAALHNHLSSLGSGTAASRAASRALPAHSGLIRNSLMIGHHFLASASTISRSLPAVC